MQPKSLSNLHKTGSLQGSAVSVTDENDNELMRVTVNPPADAP
jgi:hypothetical protein